jgi:hypothetical protein
VRRESRETSLAETDPVGPLWDAVDDLIDRAPGMHALGWHGLHLLAARRLRAQGRPVASDVYEEERAAALGVMSAPVLLERVREVCTGELVLVKGYEVALLYGDPALRPFVDIDLLVADSAAAQTALLSAGFVEVGDPEAFLDIHHQRPLWLPGLPLSVEIHHAPKWPDGLSPPQTADLLARAVLSGTGVEGISTLPPAEHALVLAAHSWAHLPLRRIQELVDIAAVAERTDRSEIDDLSRRWGIERVWRTTIECVDSLFYGSPTTSAQRIWARHLGSARERTVFESHMQRWLSGFWALPVRKAVPTLGTAIADEFRVGEGESWREKGVRARRAIRNAFMPRSQHDLQLGPGAHRRKRTRRR